MAPTNDVSRVEYSIIVCRFFVRHNCSNYNSMNWIERMYELKGKDLYSQNGEGLYLEYIFEQIPITLNREGFLIADIGGGDGIYLSNSRHLYNLGWSIRVFDKEQGDLITKENVVESLFNEKYDCISIDIDGNDYWIIDEFLTSYSPSVILCEFNASYTDSRTIKYNPDHVWAGDSYYGFTFEAGVKLAEKHGYKVIFQIADMNMIMVRADLIEGLHIPPVTYKQSTFFELSKREDWVWI